jgi:glucokinase
MMPIEACPRSKSVAIGVDLGGTKMRAALVSERGRILRRLKRPTRVEEGASSVMQRMLDLIRDIISDSPFQFREVKGVGIGSAGQIDPQGGTVLSATANLPGWGGMPLAERVQEAFGLPVCVDNDANAATWGEKQFGAGQGIAHLICITVGTGIGGGLIVDGQLYHGATGVAGEIGHLTVNLDGPPCNCGSFGCLEVYAAGPAIVARAQKAVRAGAQTALIQMTENRPEDITVPLIAQAAARGDPLASQIMEETGHYIGAGLASLINVLNPERVVIGGGVAQAGESLLKPIEKTVRARAMPTAAEALQVVPAQLGEDAGVIGAAALLF